MKNNAHILYLNFTGYSKFRLTSENFSSDRSDKFDRWNLGKPRVFDMAFANFDCILFFHLHKLLESDLQLKMYSIVYVSTFCS